MKIYVINERVLLYDSTITNVISKILTGPSLSVFFRIQPTEDFSFNLMIDQDIVNFDNLRNPFYNQLNLLFQITL